MTSESPSPSCDKFGDAATFSMGDWLAISINPTNAPAYGTITSVWEYDYED